VRAALDGASSCSTLRTGTRTVATRRCSALCSRTANATPLCSPPRSTSAPWIADRVSRKRRGARKSGEARHQPHKRLGWITWTSFTCTTSRRAKVHSTHRSSRPWKRASATEDALPRSPTHKNEPGDPRAVEAKSLRCCVPRTFSPGPHLEGAESRAEAAQAGLGIVAMKTQAGVYWDKDSSLPSTWPRPKSGRCAIPTSHPPFRASPHLINCRTDLAVLRDPTLSDDESAPGGTQAGWLLSARVRPVPRTLSGEAADSRSHALLHGTRTRTAIAKPHRHCCSTGLPESPCGDCDECPVRCAKGFDVRQRVRDIVRLRGVPREFLGWQSGGITIYSVYNLYSIFLSIFRNQWRRFPELFQQA